MTTTTTQAVTTTLTASSPLTTTTKPQCVGNQCQPLTITQGLENMTRSAGQIVTWKCVSNQVLDVDYRWYKDGTEITHRPGLSVMSGNEMSILNPQQHDNGWYLCVISNKRGETANSTAYFSVVVGWFYNSCLPYSFHL